MADRVVVAMSGGVDSSVAAALLVEQGYQVIGIHLKVWDGPAPAGARTCCSHADAADARAVCHRLGIPFYVHNSVAAFGTAVIDYFVGEYLRGRTPNPCVPCNQKIKFHHLLAFAFQLGAQYVATGHYAILEEDGAGRHRLRRGVDREKDQSYFLFNLTQRQLRHLLLPLGRFSKAEVRAKAELLGLATARKPESQDICFVPDGDYAAFVRTRAGLEAFSPGPILDTGGRVLGTHEGLPRYTVGQRRGLGLSVGKPLYVVSLLPEENALVVGDDAALRATACGVEDVNWVQPVEGEEVPATVQIRHRHRGAAARIRCRGEAAAVIEFGEPQRAVTPGQAAVFYRGDEVLGGGWIASWSAVPAN